MRVIGCFIVALSVIKATDPPYDHQPERYKAYHRPVTVREAVVRVTPFFSPEYSSSTLAALIASANHSIDIGTPGFSSWSGCTPFDDSNGTICMKACTPANQRAEACAAPSYTK